MSTPIKLPYEKSSSDRLSISSSLENNILTLTPVKIIREKAKVSPFQNTSMYTSMSNSQNYKIEDIKNYSDNTDSDNASTRHSSNNSNRSVQSTGSTITLGSTSTYASFAPDAEKSQTTLSHKKYNKNSIRFAKELENLIYDLNTIYNDIGYSTKEIVQKETLVFNQLSDTIHSFSTKAQTEKASIARENENILYSLRLILKSIGDSRGTSTIQDLYCRNMIVLSHQDLSPSKREMSLLNKRKVLLQGSNYIFNKLQRLLAQYITLSQDYNIISGLLDMDEKSKNEISVFVLNSTMCEQAASIMGDQEQLSQHFFENYNKKDSIGYLIINRVDLSEKGLYALKTRSNELHQLYQYKLSEVVEISQQIKTLISYLGLNIPMDLYSLIDDKDLFKNEDLIVQCLNIDDVEDTLQNKTKIPHSLISILLRITEALDILKSDRETERSRLHEQCVQLWSKLKIDQNEISSFMENNISKFQDKLPLELVSNYKVEIERLVELRKQSISQLIEENWDRINELWNKMGYPVEDKKEFTEYYKLHYMHPANKTAESSDLDEILLSRCEKEVGVLEEKYKLYEPLLKLIEVFESYMEDKMELERSSKDPARLLGRNSHKILLKEEKLRKKISRHFPKVVQNLISKLVNFEKQFNRPFCDKNGEPFINRVYEEEDDISSKFPRARVNNSGSVGSPLGVSPAKNNRIEKPKSTVKTGKPNSLNSSTNTRLNTVGSSIAKRTISSISSGSTESNYSSTGTTTVYLKNNHSERSLQSPTRLINAKLSPMALNKFNSKSYNQSKIPHLHGHSNMSPMYSSSPNKENNFKIHSQQYQKTRIPMSPRKLGNTQYGSFSPPPTKSITSIKKPEFDVAPTAVSQNHGKFISNDNVTVLDTGVISENNELESDDDADFDGEHNDSNFSVWKHEQLAKINQRETINLEKDVF